MITHKNVLTVPEVSCYSREEIEGGVIIRYQVRSPGETAWRPVKVYRARMDGSECIGKPSKPFLAAVGMTREQWTAYVAVPNRPAAIAPDTRVWRE